MIDWRLFTRTLVIALFAIITACVPKAPPTQNTSEIPSRIVSLDYCADQYVLKFVERERILAVSPDATAPYSYMRDAAKGLPSVRPVAEDVLVLQPDLVVRSYGGGPQAAELFQSADIPVLNVGWSGDFESIFANVERMATALGAEDAGQQTVQDMKRRLDAIEHRRDQPSVLYMTPAGATSGPGSLVHEMFETAGLENYEAQPGWRSLPLERLAYSSPDIVGAAFFESFSTYSGIWSSMQHPVAQAQLNRAEVVPLQGAWTTCGAWFAVDAVEALAKGAQP